MLGPFMNNDIISQYQSRFTPENPCVHQIENNPDVRTVRLDTSKDFGRV